MLHQTAVSIGNGVVFGAEAKESLHDRQVIRDSRMAELSTEYGPLSMFTTTTTTTKIPPPPQFPIKKTPPFCLG